MLEIKNLNTDVSRWMQGQHSLYIFNKIMTLFPHPQHTRHSRRKTAQKQMLGTTVRKWVSYCHGLCLSTTSIMFVLFGACYGNPLWLFFPRETTNYRTETATVDMPLCQRRRRTWQCSGGEGSAAALSSVIKLRSRWTVWKWSIYAEFT